MSKGSHPLNAKKSDSILITAKMIGAGGTADLVCTAGDDVLTAVYSATGTYDLTFRDSYPELKSVVGIEIVGDTAGLQARFTAIDVVAKTATILFEVAGTATVLATTDTCYINLMVRNSGRNS